MKNRSVNNLKYVKHHIQNDEKFKTSHTVTKIIFTSTINDKSHTLNVSNINILANYPQTFEIFDILNVDESYQEV